MKRVVDIAIALPLLILTSPIVVLAIAGIRLTSRGPGLFAQTRLGREAAPFQCYKLRTMQAGTASAPTHEAPAGAITPLGAILRRYKIDELPQLWNVLTGEMSLVGPRPCLPSQQDLTDLRQRLNVYSVRPGITGLAQIRGIDMSDPAACANADAEYLAKASGCLDLQILLHTLFCR
jgi:O-antigen biosynthesis protein WbqP